MQSYVIKTLVRMLDNKDLVLPAMQRPFVWEADRIVRLMDSLFPLSDNRECPSTAASQPR